MNFKEKIKRLREASENNRLIIFVGAGVSNNSGIPSWRELIKCFAIKLNIDKCNKCKLRSPSCPPDCVEKYNFCQDDYLKIPQYFCNKSKSDYLKTIQEVFSVDAKPNLINEMIMELQPKHIITTNFDKLIENTDSPNNMIYRVVSKDEDLLTYKSSHSYIIKMHGDINEPEKIVLMENDYLNYSQNHILIETFIKSLLVDHIFLFIGYSLNDYNLKLIISWLEYLARGYKKGKRQKNYILIEHRGKYIGSYFSKNNIITISVSEIPNSIKKRYSNIMPNEMGRNICALLKCILETSSDYLLAPLLDVLYERYQVFRYRKRVSFEELKQYHSFGALKWIGLELELYSQSEFDSLKEILTDLSGKADFIKTILLRTGIETVSCKGDSVEVESSNDADSYMELLELDQKNCYKDVLLKAEAINDEMAKAYYLYLTSASQDEFSKSMEKINKELSSSNDYFKLLVFKFNDCCLLNSESLRSECFEGVKKILKNIPSRNRKSYRYFESILKGNYKNIIKCNTLADKCIEFYIHTTCYGKIENDELLMLQAVSYDYYHYVKINNLMINNFSDSKNILEPYVKAMICTYSPKEEKINIFFGLKSNPPKRYFLNSTDLDILVKYTNLDKLKSFFQDYRVKELKFIKDVKIDESFINLCDSVMQFPKGILVSYLKNFLSLLIKCSSEDFDLNVIGDALADLLSSKDLLSNNILPRIFNELKSFFEIYRDIISKPLLVKVVKGFLNRDSIEYCKKNDLDLNLRRFFKLFPKYYVNKINKEVDQLIRENKGVKEKIEMIHLLCPLFDERQKNIYLSFLKDSIESVPIGHLYDYILEYYFRYERGTEERYFQFLKEEVDKRKKKPGVRTMPDYLLKTIDELIILFLLKKVRSLKKFKCFSEYSEHLSFLLDPEDYDFSKIKTLDYMWENFLGIRKYRKILVKNGLRIKEYLEKAVQNGWATEGQKILLYRYFLSDKETYKYK